MTVPRRARPAATPSRAVVKAHPRFAELRKACKTFMERAGGFTDEELFEVSCGAALEANRRWLTAAWWSKATAAAAEAPL